MRSLVAVVGVGAVLPDARTADDLWGNLVAGRSALRLPRGEIGFDTRCNISSNHKVGAHTFRGGWIADSWQFDWRRYRIPPADAAIGNRMQFATLEAGSQALDAVKNIPRQRTAIIVGASGLGFQKDGGLRVRSGDLADALRAGAAFGRLDGAARERVASEAMRAFTARLKECSSDDTVGSLASVAAARIAMHHDLYGPHYAVDADHASALAALEIAVAGLVEGEWDCALAGGISELLTPTELAAYAELGALSPSGRLRPFAGDADGTLLGEGAALFALKRLDDAVRDGDRVLAVVRAIGSATATMTATATATATATRATRVLAPDAEVIARAIEGAWRAAERNPADARLFECHAGGVLAGDAAEAAALRGLVAGAARPIPVGAIKARLGHLRAAAGAAGLLSTVLSLHHRRLVPSIDRDEATRDLDPRLQVVDGAVELGSDEPLTAGVTAIALDGQTFHVVVESFAPERVSRAAAPPPFRFAPLAVTGMAGSFAGAPDLERFWDNLAAGRDQVVDVPASRWPLERYYSADPKERSKSSARMGSFIELPLPDDDDRARDGDATAQLDATQLLVARVAADAWRDAGAPACDPARARVFLGFMPFVARRWLAEARVNYRELAAALAETLEAERVPAELAAQILDETERGYAATLPPLGRGSLSGWLGSMAAAAVARRLGFAGGHFAVESACASTLAALHAAAQSLRLHRCDVAVVGGAWCDIAPEFYVATSRFNALSPGGIAPFDARALGFVPGEGAGVLVLERADDARKSGRRVRALVRGCAGSSDGKGRSVLTPSVEGESLALSRALESAELDGTDVDYVECHGTGTALGDSVEAMALACSYGGAARRAPLRIGSVKSNLGHLIAAAGAPALQKVVLALEHDLVPPSLHCERPNPKIDFAAAGLEVVRAPAAWPRGAEPRRAGVSAFGIGGSNFHAIVEEPRAAAAEADKPPVSDAQPAAPAAAQLFAFVGADVDACVEELTALAAMLAEVAPEDFADAARSTREQAAARAPTSPARLALTAASSSDLERRAEALASTRAAGRAPSTLEPLGVFVAAPPLAGTRAMLFPGQGSQYAGMLRELAGELPLVAQLLDRADAVWRALTDRPLRPALWPLDDGAETSHEDLHAAVFTVNCALCAALAQLGVRGDVYIGQSAGELAALVAAGVLGFEDGLRAMHARTRAVLELPLADRGRMAAVACGADRLQGLVAGVEGMAVVAADNCPTSSLASGDTAAMTSLEARCAVEGIDCVPLAVSHAYHSPIIAAAAARYGEVLRELTWNPPRATVISTVDLATYDDDVETTIARLVRQYTTPVRFAEAVELAYARGTRLFFEAGPKWPLTSYVRQILDGRPFVAQAAMHPKVGERQQLSRLVACAFVHGAGALEPAEEAEVTTTNPMVKPAAASAPEVDEAFERVRALVVAALAARTGYPEEMLDLDLDLEGDLGIDTVKQVEVFARVRDELGLAKEEGVSLRQLNTLRKVIGRLAGRLSTAVVATTQPAAPTRFEEVRARVVAALIERTGYPVEMLELDLDLEGDLGIDTVKQVEVFARVRDELGLAKEEGVSLRQFNTLRKVIERLAARLEGAPVLTAAKIAPAVAPSASATKSAATSAKPTTTTTPPTPTPTPTPTPVPATSAARHYPLAGRVIEKSASRLVVERLFAATTDYYLQDARVAGRACVPAAIAWEALAETAELLLGAPVTAASALKSAGPLFLDGDGRVQVRIEAERAGDGVHATLFVRTDGGAPKVRCGAEFTAAAATPIAVARDVGRALDRRGQSRNGHAVTAADPGVQLGETLGGCVWARSLSFCELVGGIRADSEMLFEAVTAPRFVLAPAVLECAFMLAGFGWYALTRQSGIPVEVERIAIGRAPELDEEVLCHVKLRQGNGDTVSCDLVLLGADRVPLFELSGVKLMPVDRVVDMATNAPDAVSWTRFCQALQDRNGGTP
jgi:acyl transferase domain-containing protein/molybdopterin converting factor small subunit